MRGGVGGDRVIAVSFTYGNYSEIWKIIKSDDFQSVVTLESPRGLSKTNCWTPLLVFHWAYNLIQDFVFLQIPGKAELAIPQPSELDESLLSIGRYFPCITRLGLKLNYSFPE